MVFLVYAPNSLTWNAAEAIYSGDKNSVFYLFGKEI